MTARRLRGLEAIHDAAVEATPAVYVLNVGDIPRVALSVREFALSTGMPTSRILREIHNGRIRVIGGGYGYVIPVSELATVASWAEHLNPTA